MTVAWCVAATVALVVAVVLGVYGAFWWDGTNWALAAAVPVGVALVVGYNLELAGGRLHNDLTFALGWGGFPVVVGYLAQVPGARQSTRSRSGRGAPARRRAHLRPTPAEHSGP